MTQTAAADDEELLRRFAGGEAHAFEQLYRRHELKVFRYLLRNLQNRALAEDALQETWFAVARDAARYQPRGARFTTWLFTIAHHRMIDALRAARATVEWDTAEEGSSRVVDVRDGTAVAEPYAATVATEQLGALLRALATLPEEQRQAFLLQQEAELSVEEIASVCGCAFEAAKSRLRYARSRLRELLQDWL
ncbi:MAG TPA: sigma-70 family RNA polymerase sigma factor [Steroidobacteraceae bacterium]|nr:sigma-70 family RNA polymerase sigma factor [Steroidobacteraceae bacterium]